MPDSINITTTGTVTVTTSDGVGRLIKSRKKLAKLKPGTVVVNRHGRPQMVASHGKVALIDRSCNYDSIRVDDVTDGFGNPPYRVIYVPAD